MRGWRVELERAGKTLKFNLCSAEKLDGRPADTTIRNYLRFLLALPRRYNDYIYYGVTRPSVAKAMAVLHIRARRLFSVEERALILKG